MSDRSHQSFRQEILDCLDDARASEVAYVGGRVGVLTTASGEKVNAFCTANGWESVGFAEWRLPDDVYDMRQSLRYLAEQYGRIDADGAVTKEFRVQFSKAIRIHCDRGALIADAPDLPNFVHRRFVRRGASPVPGQGQGIDSPTERLIMATLDAAKGAGLVIPGYADGVIQCHPTNWRVFREAGWEEIDYIHWRLPVDVYDLRVSLAYLHARQLSSGRTFSRAVRRLCDRGALVCKAPDLPTLKQCRFVKRSGSR